MSSDLEINSFVLWQAARNQRGIALIASLLMLLVITIIAVGMFRSFTGAEKSAGNLRDKQRAFGAAVTAEQYAEWWLSQQSSASGIIPVTTCNSLSSIAQACSSALANATQVPWQLNGSDVGTTYTPPNMNTSLTGGNDTYYKAPRFYIHYLGLAPGGQGGIYQIDAVGYGGSQDTLAVVESTFQSANGIKDLNKF